jgi:hypothetical protein
VEWTAGGVGVGVVGVSLDGQRHLAERREQARTLRAQGFSIPQIAERLGVSQFTVKADLTGYVRPSRQRPEGLTAAQQHAFHAPIQASAATPDRELTTAVRCVCPAAPWCTGPSGPGWIDCVTRCKACNPPTRRPRNS